MVAPKNRKTSVVILALTTIISLQSANWNWQAVAIGIKGSPAQTRSPIFAKEQYVTHLLDVSGKKLAQVTGEMRGFNANGQRLLTESSLGSGHYHLFTISGKELLQFEGRLAKFSPDGQRVIAMLRDKDDFQLYDSTGKKLAQLPGSAFYSPIFSQNGQRLITLTDDSAYLFDAFGRKIAQMQGRYLDFGSGFDSSGQRLTLSQLIPSQQESSSCTLFSSLGQTIARLPKGCAGISPKGQKIFTTTGNWKHPSLSLYDFLGKNIAQLAGLFAIFSLNEKYILTMNPANGDSSYLYNSMGKKIARLRGSNGRFSPTGKHLLSVSGNITYLYDISGKELAKLPGDRAAFLPKSDKFVTFLFGKNKQNLDVSGGKSRLFDASGKELASLQGDFELFDIVLHGAGNLPPFLEDVYQESFSFFSSDGERLVTHDSQNSYLYNASGKQLAKLTGLSLRFSATGQHLITVSKGIKKDEDGRVYLFDHSGKKVMDVQAWFGVFSPDGQRIAITEKVTSH